MESPEFEDKIQWDIVKKSGGIPIISVTQKPTDFGTNICVGDVGASEQNLLRQMLIACESATTKYVISCESDCLYDGSYFKFIPPTDTACYRNNNTYLLGYKRDYFYKKPEGGLWCQVVNRKFLIKRLEKLLEGAPKWDATAKNFVKDKGMKFFDSYEYFTTENPCISIKTGKGMRQSSHSERLPIYELPYWKSAKSIREKYL